MIRPPRGGSYNSPVLPVCRANGKTGTHRHRPTRNEAAAPEPARRAPVFMDPGRRRVPRRFRDDSRRGGRCAALAVLLLAGCQTAPTDYLAFEARREPVNVAAGIAENVGACWFGGGRPAFAELSYAPELASYSNRPRVLIVQKADPTGLPLLVIEAVEADRGASVKLFGPLMASAEAPAIRRDVERWAGGASGCSSQPV